MGLGYRRVRQLLCFRYFFIFLDLDGYSDLEEFFVRDFLDFFFINVDFVGLDDEDDISIGMFSLMYRFLLGVEEFQVSFVNREEVVLLEFLFGVLFVGFNFISNFVNLVFQGMIQLVLVGVFQLGFFGLFFRRVIRGLFQVFSLDLDIDVEGDDFEFLDQLELNQLDFVSFRSY